MTPATATQSGHEDSIDHLKEEFRLAVGYLSSDPELQRDVTTWLQRADQLPATTLLEYIERELSDLRRRDDPTDGDGDTAAESVAQYDMRRSGEDGAEEFPDACKGCPHYGTRCPVFSSPTEADRRNQFQRTLVDASSARVKQRYRTFATENECHRIPAFIRDYETRFEDLTDDGWELLKRVNKSVNVGFTDEQADGARTVANADSKPQATPDGGAVDG